MTCPRFASLPGAHPPVAAERVSQKKTKQSRSPDKQAETPRTWAFCGSLFVNLRFKLAAAGGERACSRDQRAGLEIVRGLPLLGDVGGKQLQSLFHRVLADEAAESTHGQPARHRNRRSRRDGEYAGGSRDGHSLVS